MEGKVKWSESGWTGSGSGSGMLFGGEVNFGYFGKCDSATSPVAVGIAPANNTSNSQQQPQSSMVIALLPFLFFINPPL